VDKPSTAYLAGLSIITIMIKNLSVLVITPEPAWPVTNGWDVRHLQLIRSMAEFGELDVVTLADPLVRVDHEETRCQLRARSFIVIRHSPPSKRITALKGLLTSKPLSSLMFDSDSLRNTIEALSARNRYDVCLVLGNICMSGYAADVQARVHVLDMCDDEALNYERRALVVGNAVTRTYYRWQANMIRSHLRRTSVAFTRILAISEVDAESLSRHVDVPVVMVPNCVDAEHFRPTQLSVSVPRDPLLLFVGTMRYWPNRDAVKWFTSSVMPWILEENPRTRLQLVGPGTEKIAIDSPFIIKRGFADDLAAEYRACDVFVCPLRVGTGVKNKLMEALASGCAIVSTDVGIEGLAVRHGEHLLVANDPLNFAHAVNRLLHEPELRIRLGKSARALAKKTLSTSIVGDHLRAAMLPNENLA
jgi:glycosyltransferase involved in cell wall biosynthesis